MANLNPVDIIRGGITELTKAAGFKEGKVQKHLRKKGQTLGTPSTARGTSPKAKSAKAKVGRGDESAKIAKAKQLTAEMQFSRRTGIKSTKDVRAAMKQEARIKAQKADRATRTASAAKGTSKGKLKNRRKNNKKRGK